MEEAISIQALKPQDSTAVRMMARRCFPLLHAHAVDPSEGGLLATVQGQPAAAAILREVHLPDGRRVGVVAWLLTDAEYRGRGLAGRLVAAAVDELSARGCDPVVTHIEGHNTASTNAFLREGFTRAGPGRQWREFGLLGSAALWWRTRFVFDPGHFVWMRPAGIAVDQPVTQRPGAQRLASWFLNLLFATIAFMLGGGLLLGLAPRTPGLAELGALALAVGVLLGLREAAQHVADRVMGSPTMCFRMWESGFVFSAPVALLFGALLPMPGGIYPCADGWRYPDYQGTFGMAALFSATAVAFAVLLAIGLREMADGPTTGILVTAFLMVGKPLLLFDTVVACAPFHCFHASRIFELDWRVWIVAAAIGLTLFLL